MAQYTDAGMCAGPAVGPQHLSSAFLGNLLSYCLRTGPEMPGISAPGAAPRRRALRADFLATPHGVRSGRASALRHSALQP